MSSKILFQDPRRVQSLKVHPSDFKALHSGCAPNHPFSTASTEGTLYELFVAFVVVLRSRPLATREVFGKRYAPDASHNSPHPLNRMGPISPHASYTHLNPPCMLPHRRQMEPSYLYLRERYGTLLHPLPLPTSIWNHNPFSSPLPSPCSRLLVLSQLPQDPESQRPRSRDWRGVPLASSRAKTNSSLNPPSRSHPLTLASI